MISEQIKDYLKKSRVYLNDDNNRSKDDLAGALLRKKTHFAEEGC